MSATQAIIDIVLLGSVYALFAIGYALSDAVTGTFNFGIAVPFVAGAWSAGWLVARGDAPVTSLLLGLGIGALAGIVVDRIALWPARLRSSRTLGPSAPLVAGLAVLWLAWSAPSVPGFVRNVQAGAAAVVRVTGMHAGHGTPPELTTMLALSCVVVLLVALGLLGLTRFGVGVRAVTANVTAARAVGLDPEWTIAQVSALTGFLAAFAGCAFFAAGAQATAELTFTQVTAGALGATVIGGMGSVPGAVVGAFLIAAVQFAVAPQGMPVGTASIAALLAFVAVAAFPRGIVRPRRRRAPAR